MPRKHTIVTYAGIQYSKLQHYVYNSPTVIPLRTSEQREEAVLAYAPNRFR